MRKRRFESWVWDNILLVWFTFSGQVFSEAWVGIIRWECGHLFFFDCGGWFSNLFSCTVHCVSRPHCSWITFCRTWVLRSICDKAFTADRLRSGLLLKFESLFQIWTRSILFVIEYTNMTCFEEIEEFSGRNIFF